MRQAGNDAAYPQGRSIRFSDGGAEVSADLLAKELKLEAAAVHDLIRQGELSCLFERGEGEDAGSFRLTFYTRSCRLRLIVDAAGDVKSISRIDFGDRPLPPSLKRGT